ASRKVGRPVDAVKAEKVVAFSVALVTTRGETASSQLALPAGVTAVALSVRIHPADRYPAYEVVLRREGGVVVWHGRATPPLANELSVTMPAGVFAPGRYEVGVSGVDSRGRSEDLGEQTFTVTNSAPPR